MNRFSLATVAIVITLGAAHADPLVFSPLDPTPISRAGTAYVSMGGGAMVQQLPTFNTPYTNGANAQGLFSTAPTVTGGAGQLTLGAVINGSPVGNNSRIELSLGGFAGSGQVTGGQTAPGTLIFPVAGGSSLGCGGCDGTTILKFDYQDIGGALRLKSDFAMSQQITATPSIGLVVSKSRLKYRSDTAFQFFPGFGVPSFVDETLDTSRIGGEIGLNFGYRATQQLTFNAGASVALLSVFTSFKGNDCFSANQPIPSPCSGVNRISAVQQTDERFAHRDRYNLSGTYDTGWAKITLAGFGSWDSAMPGVTNPTVANVPAMISYESRWSYGGSAALTVPFNAPK